MFQDQEYLHPKARKHRVHDRTTFAQIKTQLENQYFEVKTNKRQTHIEYFLASHLFLHKMRHTIPYARHI